MHRFRPKTRRHGGQEGATMHYAVPQALRIPVDMTPSFLIGKPAIKNPANPMKTNNGDAF
jgi:hypothetical protein